MALSNYFENKLIDFLLRGGTYTPPTKLYFALCTIAPTAADTGSTITEISGGNYGRVMIPTGPSKWYTTQGDLTALSTGDTGYTSNVVLISWGPITWSGTVVAVAICDQSINGNLIYFSALEQNATFSVGNSINFQQGDFVLSFS